MGRISCPCLGAGNAPRRIGISPASEIDHPSFLEALVGREDDAEAVDRIGHVIAEIEVFLNGLEKNRPAPARRVRRDPVRPGDR